MTDYGYKTPKINVKSGCFTPEGWFKVDRGFTRVSEYDLDELAKYLEGYLLKIECSRRTTYDNSDDDRVEDSDDSYDFVRYSEIDPKKDHEALLYYDNEFKGVVFTIESKDKRDEYSYHAFFFDGSVQSSFSMGYSASHSSDYTYVKRVTLVKKGVDGAPESAGNAKFEQHEMYPSF